MQKAATADLSHLSQQMESTQTKQEHTGAKKQNLGRLKKKRWKREMNVKLEEDL